MTSRKTNLHVVGSPAQRAAGERLLNELHAFVGRYMAFTLPEQADAVTLWIAHTHAIDAADATPRLSIQSAEKQSGKTRLVEVLDLVTESPLSVASITASALFRVITSEDEITPTLLIDEVDTIFAKSGNRNEELRGVLNAGYRRSGMITRMDGGRVGKFPVFAPVAMAGIGELPDTVQDRSIVIRLKRRKHTDKVEPLRRRDVEPEARAIVHVLHEWCVTNVDAFAVAATQVDMPPSLSDRATDIWEPLFAIAAVAGGKWPARATNAALTLSRTGATERSVGAKLLSDVRRVLHGHPTASIPSADLARALSELEERAYEGPCEQRAIHKLLAPFDITSKTMRTTRKRTGPKQGVRRGYEVRDFADAFARYLPPDTE